MAADPMEAIREAGAAARAGMGLEDGTQDQATVDPVINLDEEEEVVPEPKEEEAATEKEQAETKETEEAAAAAEEPRPRDRSVFKVLNDIRSQKRDAEAANKQLLELIGASSVEDAAAKMAKLRESAPLSEEFLATATEMGIEDPQNLKKLADLVSSQVRANISGEITPIREQLDQFTATANELQTQKELADTLEKLDEEWAVVLPGIEAEYKPTPTQAQAAYDLIVELAHDEKYFDKELDYILYKEQERFEEIFGSRKRKGMLPVRGAPRDAVQPQGLLVKPDGSHEGVLAAAKALKAISNSHNFDTSDSI